MVGSKVIDRSFLQSLPKCEHHVHIEGALSPELLFQLAKKHMIELPTDDPAYSSPQTLTDRYARFTSLDDFLHYYYVGMKVLIDSEDYENLAWDYFKRAATDGVLHAEVFFACQGSLDRGVTYETVLSGLQAAQKRALSELGISVALIACYSRHLPLKNALHDFHLPRFQKSYQNGDVVGIGLGSSEKPFPPQIFQDLYRQARDMDLQLTAHAGEEGPASYVEGALDSLGVTRIDHGISAQDDPALLRRLAKQNILLTVCPVSNVITRNADSVAQVPIRKFLDAGVPFSINSDDPAYFGGNYILDNFVAVQHAFSLTAEEWFRICRSSIDGSWCSSSRKAELHTRLATVVDAWNHS